VNEGGCLDDASIDSIASESTGADGAEGDAEDRAMHRHLASCSACRRRLDSARDDAALLAELAASVTPGAVDTLGASSATADDPPGYALQEEIHRGSQGVVYRALQRATRRVVAVKVLHRGALATLRQRQRFEREAELLATLRHPNVVTVHDCGRTRDGGFFLVMEYIEGRTLDHWLESIGPLAHPPRRREALRDTLHRFAEIASGVAAVHQRGIIHRDLKPQNILIDDAGRPHILDFGVARPEHDDDGERDGRTMAGEFVGTLATAAPEQVSGDLRLVDTRADVYALGVILYRMLTALPPYELSGSLAAVIETIRTTEPVPPSQHNRIIDAELDRVVLHALAKDPTRRYDSAGALERDVRRHLAGDPVDAMHGGRLYLLRKALARHRAAVTVASLFVMVLAAFAVTMALLYAKADAANRARMNSLTAVLGIVQSEDLHRRIDEETASRLLARIEESLRGNLMDQGAEAWAHFRELGLRQLKRGDAAAALRQFETALDLIGRADPDDLASVADLNHQRGRALWFLHRFDDALVAYQRALAIERGRSDDESEFIATSLTHLGATYRALGRLDDAEESQRSALAMRRRLHGEDDHRYAASLNNLGVLLRERGRHQEALALFEEALAIARRKGAGSEGIGAALHNIGLQHAELGRLDLAERSLLEALDVKRTDLEDDHPSVVSTRRELEQIRAGGSRSAPSTAAEGPKAPARTPLP